jgi:hypothetical protein
VGVVDGGDDGLHPGSVFLAWTRVSSRSAPSVHIPGTRITN